VSANQENLLLNPVEKLSVLKVRSYYVKLHNWAG
jgi:hypothetical protein